MKASRTRSVATVAVLVVLAGGLTAPLRSDDPVSSSITFNREVIRILQKKCLSCHSPGAISMSLASYREARLWARSIREELIEQRMPPWAPAAGYGTFANDISLTQRELTMLLTWTDGGLPKGDDRDLPREASSGADSNNPAAAPGHRLFVPIQRIRAGEDSVRRVLVDTRLPGLLLRQVQFKPGNVRVLRAAFVYLAAEGDTAKRATPRGQWLGAWTPWHREMTPEDGLAFRLPRGAKLLVELHYRGADRDVEDRSSIELLAAPGRATAVGEVVVEAASAGTRMTGEAKLTRDADVWAIVPRMPDSFSGANSSDAFHAAAPTFSLEVTARKPDGSAEVLLWIPNYRGDWPTPYIPRQPVRLPRGTIVRIAAASGSPSTAEKADASAVAVTLSTAPIAAATAQRETRRRP